MLGRYRIEEEIGSGGMGVVYRVRDEKLARDLAIKVLRPGLLGSGQSRKRFRNEAMMLSKLNHPAIQIIHDFDEYEGTEYLVSELVPGMSLDQRVKMGPLPEKDVVQIGVQLAQGLAAAHAAGVLHRDLKPSNLRVTPQGHLKILDFGVATLSREALSQFSETLSAADAPSNVAGTLPYMSPEQLLGNEADARSDIYSAGVVFYELATGQMPFRDALITKLTDAILHRAPAAPSTLNKKISADLERVILKCLEKDPELRYQSAKDLVADLRRMELQRNTATIAPMQEKKGGRAAMVAGAVALVLVAGAAAAGWYWRVKHGGASGKPTLRYEQITNFADSATSPALSADGRMLTFIRGENTFLGPGQIYVKLLPNGEPVQLTHDAAPKMSPAFSPAADRIGYGSEANGGIDTWTVPTLGGQADLMLANASGLTWPAKVAEAGEMMFSEFTGQGIHMGVVAARDNRGEQRSIYLPQDPNGMAHRSNLSPDGKSVLVVEMNLGGWLPCRLVPFEGGTGKSVGPAPAQCTSATWSPDGKWMYFSANAGNGFHIWRQAYPDGIPEQLSTGPAEEQGLSFAPDGKSFVTAVGSMQSTIWLHDGHGERQITSEGFAFLPSFSRDERVLYYLERNASSTHFVAGDLWSADLQTGEHRHLLPGISMEHYDISADRTKVLYVTADVQGHTPVWIAALDGSEAPRKLTSLDAVRALFGPDGTVYFVGGENGEMHLYRMKQDGSGLTQVISQPAEFLYSVSPDGKQLAIWVKGAVWIQPVDGGKPQEMCSLCGTAGEENRGVTPPLISWSGDQKFMYWHVARSKQTYMFALSAGKYAPEMPKGGIKYPVEVAKLPGARLMEQGRPFMAANGTMYAYPKVATQRNIYRVWLE
jgi:Tol biopolymer transport system component